MNTTRLAKSVTAAIAFLSTPALAQLEISWWTIEGGGGVSSGGDLTIQGTIAQADAGTLSSPGLTAACGYWSAGSVACYANCDNSTGTPALTANDFQCFLNQFAAGQSYANCDGSSGSPSLTANDFLCFLNEYAAGCL